MKFSSHYSSKNIWLIKAVSREMVICLILVLVPVFFPRTAHAGLFSIFSSVSADQVSAAQTSELVPSNSQNMALLKAAVNPDPNPNKGGDETPHVSGNALVADIGPSGTVNDIEEPTNTQISIYVVHSGDTLSEIAKMFDVSVNTIIWANNLGANPTLKEGQTLVILPISGIRYTVKKGDTIKGIVLKYKADLTDVLGYNALTIESPLHQGDIIIIPDAEPQPQSALAKRVTTKIAGGDNPLHDANGPSYPGYYIRPVRGGARTQGLHGYNAVDLAISAGAPIYAAAEGTVIASVSGGGWNGGYGNYVIISHPNGTQTLYAHTSKNLVIQGQHVDQGDIIAKVGATGHATGPHVHFEIRGAKNPF